MTESRVKAWLERWKRRRSVLRWWQDVCFRSDAAAIFTVIAVYGGVILFYFSLVAAFFIGIGTALIYIYKRIMVG